MRQPFDWSIFYHLPLLLIVVSLVYCATRHDRWDRILTEAVGWVVRMGGFLAGLGALLYTLSTYPKLAPYAGGAIGVVMVVYYLISSPWFRKAVKPLPAAAPAPPAPPVS
jgi:hypothetical protein